MREQKPTRGPDEAPWTADEDQQLYTVCLEQALAETQRVIPRDADDDVEKADEKPKTLGVWAAGNVRIGELILIIDSDTRVPVDCFLDAASEMHESPECAIIQHVSGVVRPTAPHLLLLPSPSLPSCRIHILTVC